MIVLLVFFTTYYRELVIWDKVSHFALVGALSAGVL